MKFALVNDRTPGKQSSCVLCGEPIETGYLREIGTRLFYCDHDCYADHRKSAVMALASFAKVSLGFLAPSQMKERSEAERWGPNNTCVWPESSDNRRCGREIC
jgi:hypothetical protein